MRLSLLCTLATTLILCASTSTSTYAADAVWKPRKAVEIVVGAQAGGANDRMGRVLQKILTDTNALPVPALVVNKPGQGQALSVAYLNTHVGDPHYLVILGSSWVTTSITNGSASTHRDLTPIVKVADTDLVLYVNAGSPLRNTKDIVDGLAKNVAAYSFGFSTSAGNASHIALAELARIAGEDFPYDPLRSTFFLGRESIIARSGSGLMAGIFPWMSRLSRDATSFFHLPPGSVVELGVQVEI